MKVSKYQEALDEISYQRTYSDIEGYSSIYDLCQNEISLLQELVDRATPVKVVDRVQLFDLEERNKIGKCECGCGVHEDDNFCSGCGRPLDWSEE
jgi:hypothetical protein